MDFNKFIGISHTDDEAAVGADLSAQIRINLTKWRWILCRGDGVLSGGQVEWSGAGRARCAMHYVCAYGCVPPSQDVPLPCGALSTDAWPDRTTTREYLSPRQGSFRGRYLVGRRHSVVDRVGAGVERCVVGILSGGQVTRCGG